MYTRAAVPATFKKQVMNDSCPVVLFMKVVITWESCIMFGRENESMVLRFVPPISLLHACIVENCQTIAVVIAELISVRSSQIKLGVY